MNSIFKKYGDKAMLWLLFVTSLLLRYKINFSSELAPGKDGIYYALQVRHLLESGSLGFPDMPFTFWLEAAFAKLLMLFSNHSADSTIDFACRLVNIIVPSLIVFPVYGLFKSVSSPVNKFLLLTVLVLSVLNPSVLVLFAVDFHKNAIGILMLFTTLYYIRMYFLKKQKSTLILGMIFILLTLLTHFGCFSALLLFLLILFSVLLLFKYRTLKKLEKRVFVLVVLVTLILPGLIYSFDSRRFLHLFSFINSPGLLVKDSVLIGIIKGNTFLHGPRLVLFFILNCMSVFSVWAYVKLRGLLSTNDRVIFLSSVLWGLCLTNPLIGKDIYERLLFLSVVPFTVVAIFAFRYLPQKASNVTALIILVLILFTVVTSPLKRRSVITKNEYIELKGLNKIISDPAKTLIITKHGLEWWTNWTLRTKVGLQSDVKPQDYSKYTYVMFLQQKNEKQNRKDTITGIKIFDSKYFELYQLSPRLQ